MPPAWEEFSVTNLFLRLFVKDYLHPEQPEVRARVGRLSGLVGIVCNILLCAGKLVVGTLSGSVAITADALNNLSDATSSIVTLVGFKLAELPADTNHPFGHARYEYVSGLAVAGMIVVIGFELARSSVGKIFHPSPVEFSLPIAIVLIGSIAVKLCLAVFNRKLGTYIHSGTLMATAADSRNDVIATGAVLAASLIEWATAWQVDGYMGLAVALFILYSGADLAKQTISPLLGEAASPELRQLIIDVINSDDWVLGYHDLMVHDYGPGQRFASIHVEMDRTKDPLLCHEHIDNLERLCLKDHNVHLVIHYDPVTVGDPLVESLHQQVMEILADIDQSITIHDFRVVSGVGHTNLIFDMAVPEALHKQQAFLKQEVERRISEANGSTYYAVITFDLQQFN